MQYFYLLLILLTLNLQSFSQQKKEEPMVTDRPSETFSPEVVLKNRLQIEAGFRRERDVQEGIKHLEYMYPTALIKYGLFKKLELSVLIEEEGDYDFIPEKQETSAGLEPVKVGFKYNFIDQKGAMPKTSLLGRVSIPKAASEDFKGEFVAPMIRLLMENKLSEKLSIAYNIGEEWEDDDEHGRFFYSFSPQFEISDKFKVFAEAYGHVTKDQPAENGVDAGFLFQFLPNFQMDASAGVGISKLAPDHFIELGLSFRLPR